MKTADVPENHVADGTCWLMITLIHQIPQEKRFAWKPDIVLTTAKSTLPPALRDLIILKGLQNLLAMPFQF